MKNMMTHAPILCLIMACALVCASCKKENAPATTDTANNGVTIAYVNGDSVLLKYEGFQEISDVMKDKQQKAEAALQSKLQALEKEFIAYQQKAQSGTMTPKDMEARERYLGSRQESLMAERDAIAQAMLAETDSINKQLKAILDKQLDIIKARDGYDFILNYVAGGAILSADPKYDITEEVLKMLHESGDKVMPDTTAN
jgi:outer membrane protein